MSSFKKIYFHLKQILVNRNSKAACDGDQLTELVKHNDIENVRKICLTGIDLNAIINSFGENLLFIACEKGLFEVAKILMENGINIFHPNKGYQLCLHAACKGGNVDIIKELIKKGINPTHRSLSNLQPLSFALKYERLEPVIFFFENSLLDKNDLIELLKRTSLNGINKNYTRKVWDLILKHYNLTKKDISKLLANRDDINFEKLKTVYSHQILKCIKTNKNNNLSTYFGGQPTWLTTPQWPVNAVGKPLVFVGQISIDKTLFPNSLAERAYIFTFDNKDKDLIDETTETVVVLQPGDNSFNKTLQKATGGSLTKDSFALETKINEEFDYIPDPILSMLNQENYEKYQQQCDKNCDPINKIGGRPQFIQAEEYPEGGKQWSLLLQLEWSELSKLLNLETEGNIYTYDSVEYFFLSSDGTKSVVIVQHS